MKKDNGRITPFFLGKNAINKPKFAKFWHFWDVPATKKNKYNTAIKSSRITPWEAVFYNS
jgi:hypothetical protein